jgi:hypothetical protein
LLGALPAGQAPVALALLGLLVPVAAGVAGGVVVARGCGAVSLPRAAAEGLALAPCVGAVAAALALVSGGPLGNGRLSAVGPSAWQTGLFVLAEVAVPAAVAAVVTVRRR